jgi:cytochrome c-type biogenesis protein CcmH
LAAVLLALLLAMPFAHAGEALPAADDPVLEERVNSLAQLLRCLVCQNQTIADSHADLAVDLKKQIREQLKQGRSEKQVADFMVQRYGEFVLYKPPVKETTWLLWFGPLVLLIAGLAVLILKLRRRRDVPDVALTEADRARARGLLEGSPDKERG